MGSCCNIHIPTRPYSKEPTANLKLLSTDLKMQQLANPSREVQAIVGALAKNIQANGKAAGPAASTKKIPKLRLEESSLIIRRRAQGINGSKSMMLG